jgi:SpoVK/Ycf46/Vps4 family AAA+-type ATPase
MHNIKMSLKRKAEEMSSKNIIESKTKRPKLKLEDSPNVFNINDLINLSKNHKYYKNIDMLMLWRIVPYLEELNKMIGMTFLKETIFFQIIYYIQGMHTRSSVTNSDYLHTLITGPPGCGKTTVAHIISKIYRAMGILSENGEFKIAHRDDFVGEYVGHTAVKTRKLLESCLGGVLFIDEVYSLAPQKGDTDSFSKEAIDTINAFLSEHKNDMCCIVAGYEDDVRNCFFSVNQGLERRFPWVHKIAEYSNEELTTMFEKMVNDSNWLLNVNKDVLINIIKKNRKLFKNVGGDIETFFSKCKMFHSRRVFSMSKENKFILCLEDIQSAIDYLTGNAVKEDEPPWGMYL